MVNISSRNVITPAGVVTLFSLTNRYGAAVEVSSLGAGITKIIVPDRHSKMDDVVLGYADAADYFNDDPCAGKTPGRFANRIANGRFVIDGHKVQLVRNNGSNALHGGPTGFQNRNWDAVEICNGVRFVRVSPDGEEAYPGTLSVSVDYVWNEDNELEIKFHATTDAPTVVNLTNHAYFNLAGHNSGSCLDQLLTLKTPLWLPVDNSDIPTGEIASVQDTPLDFTKPTPLSKNINDDFSTLIIGKGYNHYMMFDDYNRNGELRHIATLYDAESGRILTVKTTYPGTMIYTGNWLAGSPVNKSGRAYCDHDGIAIECQYPPDAPNHDNFPWQMLRPGDDYSHVICYKFSTDRLMTDGGVG